MLLLRRSYRRFGFRRRATRQTWPRSRRSSRSRPSTTSRASSEADRDAGAELWKGGVGLFRHGKIW
eukprot:5053054-Heterocapsa_arctica.AAC.1